MTKRRSRAPAAPPWYSQTHHGPCRRSPPCILALTGRIATQSQAPTSPRRSRWRSRSRAEPCSFTGTIPQASRTSLSPSFSSPWPPWFFLRRGASHPLAGALDSGDLAALDEADRRWLAGVYPRYGSEVEQCFDEGWLRAEWA